MNHTETRVRAILEDIVPDHLAANYDADADLEDIVDVLGRKGHAFDSLDHVEFVMMLEEVFNVEITDAEAKKVRSISKAVAIVDQKLGR